MILQALATYYHRTAEAGADIAAPGFQKQPIPFLLIRSKDGTFVDLLDTRSGQGKKKIARNFTVPKAAKKTSGIVANLLWDTPAYVFGRPKPGKNDSSDRAEKQRQSFIDRIKQSFPGPIQDTGISSVVKFLEAKNFQSVFNHPSWEEIEDRGLLVSFKLAEDNCLISERQAVVDALTKTKQAEGNDICLVSGQPDIPVRLHTAIKGVWGAQTSGANIVSFNLKAFNSFGKEQGFNAPVGKRSEFAYTTALNNLLSKGSHQRIQVGDASTVFWAEKKHDLENVFANLFGEPAKDNPIQDYKGLVAMFRAPETGCKPELDPNTRFYVLGLAPNAARIAVRFWYDGTVKEVANNIYRYFEDCSIVHGPNQPETLSLFRLLTSTALKGKSENIQPNLAGEFMRTILAGTPYPQTLLSAAIRRLRAEREATYPRIAIIKAILARESRYYNRTHKEVEMALDRTNDNVGYRLGRLFAVLEKAQEEANPGINVTIRDRFYGSASSNPVTAFPYLMKLKNHHISKLDSRGRAVNLERMIGDIFNGIDAFPAHLSLPDQGRFAVGYYHQRQDFFTKKDDQ